ncbi:hypothetical protein [Hymenobacter metallilatus]|uniref:Uncharacterized protein n=1 Tax=Hymenobacter metallilatus TaxID=2493666 RepID=A0A3R9NBV9_9BACT|nr:hypothetical protein [Hymenobacter metallilatus]RSK24200.1 hypothetical protein EI290_20685 [Hymenobacter metallilatus]
MNKKLLVGGALALGYVLLRESQNLKNTINGLSLNFLPGDWPRINGGRLIFSIDVQVKNPGTRDLPIDQLHVRLSRITRTGSYLVASTPAAGVALPAFAAGQTTKFTVEIEAGLLDAITEMATIVRAGNTNKFKVESIVRAGGLQVTLPPFTYTLPTVPKKTA